jgi:hypothetical protein
MLATLRHLLPDSIPWRLVVERTLKKYLRGIATVGSDVVAFTDDIYDDLWPDLTRELQEWLDQFGIDYWPWSNDDDMRAYLDFRWGEDRGISPKHLQDKLRAAGFTGAYVYDSYDLADLELTTYTSDSIEIQEDSDPHGFCFASDGLRLYVAGSGTNSAVYQYTLTDAYNLQSAGYDALFDTTTQEESPFDVKLSTDGTKMFVLAGNAQSILEYTLPTPFVVTGATYVDSLSVSAKETAPLGFHWKPDGKEVYIVGSGSADIHQYTLSTAWDVSTGTFTRTYDPAIVGPRTITFNEEGTEMYLLRIGLTTVHQWDLSTAWDISTASSSAKVLDLAGVDTTPVHLVREHGYLFMLGTANDTLYRLRYGAWRNPLDYAIQPKTGTVQCGDDGSGANPVAECGEEPTDQTSLDSAVCNEFLANETWYLVNDTLTNTAPRKIPTLEWLWAPFWYVGGTPIGTELEVDEYDRQRFEKLCLKHGPAEQWIVTIIDIWQTTQIGSWAYEVAGGTLGAGEWQFTSGTTTPVRIWDVDDDGVNQSAALSAIASGDKLRFVRDDDGTWIEYLTTGAASDQTTFWTVAINTTAVAQASDWAGFPSAGGKMHIYHRESV